MIDTLDNTASSARPGQGGHQLLLVTLAMVDIVDSTATITQLGDIAWTSRLDGFFDVLHATAASCDGVCVEHTGDGALLAFRSASQAVRSMLYLCEAAPSLAGLDVRTGVHTGEIVLRSDRVDGLAVHLTSRIQDRARPGQTLVSKATVKQATVQFAGWDIEYLSCGAKTLKGISQPVELFEARRHRLHHQPAPGQSRSDDDTVPCRIGRPYPQDQWTPLQAEISTTGQSAEEGDDG